MDNAEVVEKMVELLCEKFEKHSSPARPVGWSREIDILTLDNAVDLLTEAAEEMKELVARESKDYE